MKNFNILSSNDFLEATIEKENITTELAAQRHYYKTSLITKECYNFQYFAKEVKSGETYLTYNNKIKRTELTHKI